MPQTTFDVGDRVILLSGQYGGCGGYVRGSFDRGDGLRVVEVAIDGLLETVMRMAAQLRREQPCDLKEIED